MTISSQIDAILASAQIPPISALQLRTVLHGMLDITYTAINVNDYGTINNTPSNDTPIIDAAFAAAILQNKAVYFPGDVNYAYGGTGWTALNSFDRPVIIGDGFASQSATGGITLSTGCYLIDNTGSKQWGGVVLKGLRVSGGAGVVRDRWTSADTNTSKIIQGCLFSGYSGAAISSESSDSPTWDVTDNIFFGANSTTCIGFANAGISGGIHIGNNGFLQNRIHIKMARGGNNCAINDANYFVQEGPGTGRIAIWLVPSTTISGSGNGFVCRDVKFGNENLDPSDFCILYADEDMGSGTLFGSRMPSTAASTGYIGGHHIDCVQIGGLVAGTRSLVYTRTPNISYCKYSNIHVEGALPKQILEFANPPPDTTLIGGNVLGPMFFSAGDVDNTIYIPFTPTNGVNSSFIVDPNNVCDLTNHNLPNSIPSTADSGDYLNLLTTGINGFTLNGAITRVAGTDATGGSDLATLNFTNGNAFKGFDVAPVLELPIWIEFDAGPASGQISSMRLVLVENVGFTDVYSFPFATPTASRRLRFRFDPATVPGAFNGFSIKFDNNLVGTPTGQVTIGRVAVYQARQPVSGNIRKGVQFVENSLSIPSANPVGGGYLYTQAGALKYRGSGGGVTALAPASPVLANPVTLTKTGQNVIAFNVVFNSLSSNFVPQLINVTGQVDSGVGGVGNTFEISIGVSTKAGSTPSLLPTVTLIPPGGPLVNIAITTATGTDSLTITCTPTAGYYMVVQVSLLGMNLGAVIT